MWKDQEDYLWFARLYPVCSSPEESAQMAGILCHMAAGKASSEEVRKWLDMPRESLYSSFNKADAAYDFVFERELENRILSNKFIYQLQKGVYYEKALEVFGRRGITENIYGF